MAFLFGGWFMWFGVVAYILLGMGVDALAGSDGRALAHEQGKRENICEFMLYSCVPLIVLCALLFANAVGGNPFALSTLRASASTEPLSAAGQFAGAVLSMGALFSAGSGIVAHELMHRVTRPIDLFLARFLLAFSLDTPLAIEHVYGHHNTVGTDADPTTAKRGVGFWRYFPVSLIGGTRNAFAFEAKRLRKKGYPVISWRNRALKSVVLSLIVPLVFFLIGGWLALLAFVASALISKIYIEVFNYMGHYGLVRERGKPAKPRHSWNSYQRVTNGLMFNLPRHSSHHLKPGAPYWRLGRQEQAPQMPFGMNLMAVIALCPPVWHRIMDQLLVDWDARFASRGEQDLVRKSGWRPRFANTPRTPISAETRPAR